MKWFRRLLFVVSLLVALAAIVLLLNFTAPNPTGRRYSSEVVPTTGGTQAVGLSGEQILAQDLHTPRNDDPDQRQCICNNPTNRNLSPSDCRVCIGFTQSIANYRRPDFIAPNFIAESKNVQSLSYTYTDTLNQIGDYVIAARALGRPLWVFTRVDTQVDPEYARMVASTGGGIVPYFTTPAYIDPVDQAARPVLVAALIVLALSAVWEIGAALVAVPRQPKTPKPTQPADPHAKAVHKTDAAEDFVKAAKDHQQRKIDTEDSRDEP